MQHLQGRSNVRGILCQILQHNQFHHTPREPPSTKKQQQENLPKYQEQANSKQPNVKTAAATISNPIQQAINKTIFAKDSANTKSNN